MRVHLHTVSWNDVDMLPYFFRHYAPWVERFYFFDDQSDDGTREYLENRPDVIVGTTPRAEDGSWGSTSQAIHNSSWKRSIGEADWVIVTNLDEHLYHRDIVSCLSRLLDAGVTAAPAAGYQMICEKHPAPEAVLWRDCRMGAPDALYSRMAIFRPDRIRETNFTVGRHRAKLEGDVIFPPKDEIANLHFKHLGFAETLERQRVQARKLGEADRVHGWGSQYDASEAELRERFDALGAASVDVTALKKHDIWLRWWRFDDKLQQALDKRAGGKET